MNITELAENIQCNLENKNVDRDGLKQLIALLLDKAYEIEVYFFDETMKFFY